MPAKKRQPSDTFLRMYSQFSKRTQDIIDSLFSLALKVLFLKYKRKVREYEETLLIRKKKHRKRKYHSGPLFLKEKDTSNSISLVDFHLNNCSEIDVSSSQDLMANFGNFPLQDAIKYYEEFLMKDNNVKDIMGRRLIFNEDGKRFLYKEHTEEGKHIVAPENYVEARGKRLCWIKPLFNRTREIYRQTESFWEAFLYVGIFKVKIDSNTVFERIEPQYFLIITRRKSRQPLEFVTAYYMTSQLDLFKHLEQTRPLFREQQECIIKLEESH